MSSYVSYTSTNLVNIFRKLKIPIFAYLYKTVGVHLHFACICICVYVFCIRMCVCVLYLHLCVCVLYVCIMCAFDWWFSISGKTLLNRCLFFLLLRSCTYIRDLKGEHTHSHLLMPDDTYTIVYIYNTHTRTHKHICIYL